MSNDWLRDLWLSSTEDLEERLKDSLYDRRYPGPCEEWREAVLFMMSFYVQGIFPVAFPYWWDRGSYSDRLLVLMTWGVYPG